MAAEKIGKYEILEELGKGGMGVVYKAFDPIMEREVALKVILDVALVVPEIKQRFYREARTAGKLTHENITIVHDVGEDQGRPFIVMEYLPGYDLRSVLDERRPLSLLQKLDIAAQVARGLGYSHSRDIIHRDIKPANIRIIDDRKVKIMDFGIAKLASSSMTSTGAVIGTPYYMSPEQIQGKKVDRRSDIFSYGVLLYEFLTYTKPFTGSEPTAVMYKIVHEQPEHFDELARIVPPGLRDLVVRLLSKDPEERYQDLHDVSDRLENIIGQLKRDQGQKFELCLSEARDLLSRRNFPEAYKATEEAAALDPGSSQLMRVREEIKAAEADDKRRTLITEKLSAARRFLNNKHFTDAIDSAREVLALEKDHSEAQQLVQAATEGMTAHWFGEAQAQYRKGDLKSAEWLADKVLGTAPEHQGARQLLAAIHDLQRAREIQAPPLDDEATVAVPAPMQARRTRTRMRPRRRSRWGLVAVLLLLVVVFGGGGYYYYRFIYVPPAPVGYVALTVLPWAEITAIQRDDGQPVALRERTMTPCRLDLPPGTYRIRLTNPNFREPLVLTIMVRDGQTQSIRERIPGYSTSEALSGL
jgi:serine/threonine protein kinase